MAGLDVILTSNFYARRDTARHETSALLYSWHTKLKWIARPSAAKHVPSLDPCEPKLFPERGGVFIGDMRS